MPKHNPNGPTGLYNYENYNRPLTPYELKTVCEITVLYEYHRLKQFPTPNVALQELLKRHDNLLQILALRSQKRYDLTSDYEDKLQHARYAAMRAYEKFDIEKAKENKFHLYNYVCNCVAMYLNTANDKDNYIDCPPSRRLIRNYLHGRYDAEPQKKAEIEQRLGLKTQDDQFELRINYGALVADYVSTSTVLGNESMLGNESNRSTLEDLLFDSQNIDIDTKIHLHQLIERLNKRQQGVVKAVFIDGCKMQEAADRLGITKDQVRRAVQDIRTTFKGVADKESILM